MNILLFIISTAIHLASLSPTEGDVPNEPYAHMAQIHVNGLACVGVLYGRKCILTSSKCTKYCEDSVYIRTYNPLEKRYVTNGINETYTNNPFFNEKDLGMIVLLNATSSGYLNESLILPNTQMKGDLVYKGLEYSEEVNIQSWDLCNKKHGIYFPSKGAVCANQTGFQEECYAPFGSPLFRNNKLVGIASWCESLAYTAQEYMVFTDLRYIYNAVFLKQHWNKCK